MAAQPHSRDVKTAIGVLRADLARGWKIDDLAKACGVARRTLEKHFRQFVGCSPAEFLRTERLRKVRRELLRARPGISVTAVAGESGFTHFGRFSLAYRKRYGETPSHTLRFCRDAPDVQPMQFRRPTPIVDRPTISISPFGLDGPRAAQMAGTTEDIAAGLLRTGWVSVVPAPKGRYLLAGRIQDDGQGRVWLRAVMTDSSDGRMIWADRWNCSTTDMQGFQDWVSAQITSISRSVLQSAEIARADRGDPTRRTAWELCMRALPIVLAADPASAGVATELLDRAIDLAPRDPIARSLSAWCHGLRVAHHFSPSPEAERKAGLQLALDASALIVSDPLADTMLSAAYMLTHDLKAAEFHARRALIVDGGSSWAWGRLGWVHAYRGEVEAAIEHCQIARALAPSDPLNFVWSIGIAAANFESARYTEAVDWYRRALVEQPRAVWINRFLTPALAFAGKREDARHCFDDLTTVFPDLTIAQVRAGLPHTESLLDRVSEGLETMGMRMS